MPKSVERCVTSLSNSSKVPSSSRNSMRSRADILPSLCWRSRRAAPPPASASESRRLSSASFFSRFMEKNYSEGRWQSRPGGNSSRLLQRIARLPLPAFLLGVPIDGRVHEVGLARLDHKKWRIVLLDQHAARLDGVEWHVDDDELGLGSCRSPGVRTGAKDHQEVVVVLGVRPSVADRLLGIAETKKGVIRIVDDVLESVRIRKRIFAVGNNGHVFHAIAVEISHDERGRQTAADGKARAELLFHDRSDGFHLDRAFTVGGRRCLHECCTHTNSEHKKPQSWIHVLSGPRFFCSSAN